ncbi:RNA polymerase sigma factor [Candidatus Eisenbacteria bacterium]|uniref:RNA polymerase sigma factor n=1 Tax=Eiseniibacteriota bacterium TaxID=2212470 RepID=A0ABV6YIS0_UNCEI
MRDRTIRNLETKRSDAQLLSLALDRPGSREGRQATSQLFRRYREPVFRWCLSRVKDPELALDLSQDVLLSAYRHLSTFKGNARFSSWIFAIARNRCLNSMRRVSLFDDGDRIELLPDTRTRQDRRMEQREDEERILRLIREHLPLLDQKVLWLRCFEKVPIDGITRMLNITESSGARGVLQRARRRLRAAMAKQAGTERSVCDV